MNYSKDKKLLLAGYCLFYYGVFWFFALDHRLLSQYRADSFNYNRDLLELMVIGAGIPAYAIRHHWFLQVLDGLVLLLPVIMAIYYWRKERFSILAGMAFTGSLTLYFLLANIFEVSHQEPYVLYVLLSFAFITNRASRFYLVIDGCRYYFLYIFISAAFWKIARGAVFNGDEMSNILLFQNAGYLTGSHTVASAGHAYLYLIDHPGLSYWLYLGGILLEGCFIIGIFSRRWDRWLTAAALLFVIADCLLMRIPYWTLLIGTLTLWLVRRDPGRRRLLRRAKPHPAKIPTG